VVFIRRNPFQRALKNRLISIGNTVDREYRFGTCFALVVTRIFTKLSFHLKGLVVESHLALVNDLGTGRYLEIDGFAFHKFHRLLPKGAHNVIFTDLRRL
jgi:hypothetical protein